VLDIKAVMNCKYAYICAFTPVLLVKNYQYIAQEFMLLSINRRIDGLAVTAMHGFSRRFLLV